MSKLIEKEGRFYKECRIFMLNATSGKLLLNDNGQLFHYHKEQTGGGIMKPQHLYITSDDEIKEGDWFMSAFFSYPIHNTKELRERPGGLGWTTEELNKDFKGHKIIATTDTSLFTLVDCPVRGSDSSIKYILPQPSDKFIQAYIDAYNKGEKIEKVLVEYDKDRRCVKCKDTRINHNCKCGESDNFESFLKLKLKDNNVIIKKLKDTWSREEVIQKLRHFDMTKGKDIPSQDFDKWIEENL